MWYIKLDLPVVIKTLIGTPRLFQAVRDNLIQGYANKFALQHFYQNMLGMRWLEFEGIRLPTFQGRPPVPVSTEYLKVVFSGIATLFSQVQLG